MASLTTVPAHASTAAIPASCRLRFRFPRLFHRAGAVLVIVLAVVLVVSSAAPASAQSADAATSKAWIVVDADTGKVVGSFNAREPMRVASTAKILTALVVRQHVALDAEIPISARAESMPALKISVKAGQHWNANDLLHSMLLASANDAAVALAEAAGGGSLDGFEVRLEREARRLGLADGPTLQDPAGLDDEFSVRGGNLISARDLAIGARALLNDPLLSSIVAMPAYSFSGGDGAPHRVVGHNDFMRTYPGAIGIKTGYTDKAGSSLVAAARRDGRTYIAVVIDSTNTDLQVSSLLDAAFAGTLPPPASNDVLPPVVNRQASAGPTSDGAASLASVPAGVTTSSGPSPTLMVGLFLAALVLLGVWRRRSVVAARSQRAVTPHRAPSSSGQRPRAPMSREGAPRRVTSTQSRAASYQPAARGEGRGAAPVGRQASPSARPGMSRPAAAGRTRPR